MALSNTSESLETALRWLMLMLVVTVLAALAMPNAKSDAAQNLSISRSTIQSSMLVNQPQGVLLTAFANS